MGRFDGFGHSLCLSYIGRLTGLGHSLCQSFIGRIQWIRTAMMSMFMELMSMFIYILWDRKIQWMRTGSFILVSPHPVRDSVKYSLICGWLYLIESSSNVLFFCIYIRHSSSTHPLPICY